MRAVVMALPLLAAYDGGTIIRPPVLVRRWLTDTWLSGVADRLLQLFGGSIVPEAMGLVDLGRALCGNQPVRRVRAD